MYNGAREAKSSGTRVQPNATAHIHSQQRQRTTTATCSINGVPTNIMNFSQYKHIHTLKLEFIKIFTHTLTSIYEHIHTYIHKQKLI